MSLRVRAALGALVALGLVASLGLQPVPSAVAARPLAVGVMYHGTWANWTEAERIAVLDRMAEAGVRWIRVDVGWSTLEEHGKGVISQWYVDLLDRVTAAAAERGIEVLGILWETPSWANGGRGPRHPPDDPAEYARIARWAAERFRGRVAAWQVWNEPNQEVFFPGTDPVRYTRLLRAAYPAFKAGDPGTTVVLGAPAYNDTGWLAKVYDAGGRGHFDVMATHPYMSPSNLPPSAPDDGTIWRLAHVEAVRALMVARGDGHLPVWFTEYGWSAHDSNAGAAAWNLGVSEQVQAQYLAESLTLIQERYPYVTHAFWYMARDRADNNPMQDHYGLLTHRLEPKPAFWALKAWTGGASAPEAAPQPTPSPQPTLTPIPAPPGDVDETEVSSVTWTDQLACSPLQGHCTGR
jgi:polysaccharide biosynthesis protein PslG